jgi:hypothetical protein
MRGTSTSSANKPRGSTPPYCMPSTVRGAASSDTAVMPPRPPSCSAARKEALGARSTSAEDSGVGVSLLMP